MQAARPTLPIRARSRASPGCTPDANDRKQPSLRPPVRRSPNRRTPAPQIGKVRQRPRNASRHRSRPNQSSDSDEDQLRQRFPPVNFGRSIIATVYALPCEGTHAILNDVKVTRAREKRSSGLPRPCSGGDRRAAGTLIARKDGAFAGAAAVCGRTGRNLQASACM